MLVWSIFAVVTPKPEMTDTYAPTTASYSPTDVAMTEDPVHKAVDVLGAEDTEVKVADKVVESSGADVMEEEESEPVAEPTEGRQCFVCSTVYLPKPMTVEEFKSKICQDL